MLNIDLRLCAIWIRKEVMRRSHYFAGEESRHVLFRQISDMKEAGHCIGSQIDVLSIKYGNITIRYLQSNFNVILRFPTSLMTNEFRLRLFIRDVIGEIRRITLQWNHCPLASDIEELIRGDTNRGEIY